LKLCIFFSRKLFFHPEYAHFFRDSFSFSSYSTSFTSFFSTSFSCFSFPSPFFPSVSSYSSISSSSFSSFPPFLFYLSLFPVHLTFSLLCFVFFFFFYFVPICFSLSLCFLSIMYSAIVLGPRQPRTLRHCQDFTP
jgi:hypothetical protein